MKLQYDRDEDILMIEVNPQGIIDYAEHSGSVIAHFTAAGELVLLEVLEASAFLSAAVRAALRGEEELIPMAPAV